MTEQPLLPFSCDIRASILMSGIFGVFHRNGSPVEHSMLDTMRQAMADWGQDGYGVLLDGPVGMGQMRFFSTPEAKFEKMPIKFPVPFLKIRDHNPEKKGMSGGIVFTASGRVDNREELIGQLSLRDLQTPIADSDILYHAYLAWGENCPERIYGDWAFAAYHPSDGRLFLARDHFGNTALYYYSDPRIFAFASSRKALLALNVAAIEMDELYFAQILVSWPAYQGERTIHSPVKRLPPAHCLAVTSHRMETRRYWFLENTPELKLRRREDYVEAFKDVFNVAVRCRIHSEGCVAATLSGGLDSGSVAVAAARFLRERNKRLFAFTSVPVSDTGNYVKNGFGDEFPFAQATAHEAGNVDLFRVTADTVSPILAIRKMLDVTCEPTHAAGNIFWMSSIRQAAAASGCRVLLTGQAGNAGISWTGSVFSQSIAFQLRHFGWRNWPKEFARQYTPAFVLDVRRMLKKSSEKSWISSAIHPEFAARLDLMERMKSDYERYARTPRELRCCIIRPGRALFGSLHAENGAAHGLEIRDPTADVRLLIFTMSVPDRIFMDSKTGMDRWLIRESMKGLLPDKVRLNRERGRQSGDLIPRLRACAGEVETALNELVQGPASAYVNVPYMRKVWAMVRTDDTPEAFHKSITVLSRGIMAGLWVNRFFNAH